MTRRQVPHGVPASIDEATPEMAVVHLLRAATVEFNMFGVEFAVANGLHLTDLRAIIELLDAERAGVAASPGWLGSRLALNSASVTALLDRLEREGHVRREPDPTDRRRVRLVVSPAAKELGWAFFGPLIASVIEVTRSFDEAELATVRRFLAAVTDAAAARRRA
jgi:DNA-binding MarR family transcriptional regulator